MENSKKECRNGIDPLVAASIFITAVLMFSLGAVAGRFSMDISMDDPSEVVPSIEDRVSVIESNLFGPLNDFCWVDEEWGELGEYGMKCESRYSLSERFSMLEEYFDLEVQEEATVPAKYVKTQ